MRIADVVAQMNIVAPENLAYPWDNCGLQVGDPNDEVFAVAFCLDVTPKVIAEAADRGANMIISHHPLIFKPISTLVSTSLCGETASLLIKNNIALYCSHTCLDIADGGVNDALCSALELLDVQHLSDNEGVACGRTGMLKSPMAGDDFSAYVAKCLKSYEVAFSGLDGRIISRVALCSGAGDDMAVYAKNSGADVFVTGELRYHTALELFNQNMPFVTAGHYATEVPVLQQVIDILQKRFSVLKYTLPMFVVETDTNPYQ